ncbi:MAG: four helix bundle protein [Bacteroidota bacterium]
MATIKRFEDIISWQKARELNKILVVLIDADRFKKSYRLINQIEGSAGSIMDNIAEGFERSGNREFLQFLYIAKGSCGEFRSQLYRAADRNYLNEAEFENMYKMAMEIIILLQKLIDYLENSELKGVKYKTR